MATAQNNKRQSAAGRKVGMAEAGLNDTIRRASTAKRH